MTDDPQPSYLSPKLVIKPTAGDRGNGVYAAEPIAKGELLAVWGGRIVDRRKLAALSPNKRRYVLQVDDNRFLASLDGVDPPDYINHCCHPNAGLRGEDALVAMRKIKQGEEIVFDYATTDSCALLEFECGGCGRSTCRGQVTAQDWKRPEVQARNRGHFSPYLQRRIDAMKRGVDAIKRRVARGGAAPDGARVALRQSDK